MNKFKEGDEIVIVKTTKGCQSNLKVGDKAIIDTIFFNKYKGVNTSANMLCDKNIGSCFHGLENIELAEDTSKPTYTQKMYDNNQLPAVGMTFQCWDRFGDDHRLFDFNGKEVKVIGITNLNDEKVITFSQEGMGIGCGVFVTTWVNPIPAPIELIDGNAYTFDYQSKLTIGLYYKLNNMFYMADFSLSVKNCSNIRPMTVAESK